MIGAARNGWERWRCAHDSDLGLAKVLLRSLGEELLEQFGVVKRLRRALSDAEQQRQVCEREAVAARLTQSFLLEELKNEERLIENLRQRYAKSAERNRELAKELAEAKAHAEQVEASFRGVHCTKCGSEALAFRKEGEEFLCIMCATDRAEKKGREAAMAERSSDVRREQRASIEADIRALEINLLRNGANKSGIVSFYQSRLDELRRTLSSLDDAEPADSTRRTLPPGADVLELAEAANG